MKPTTPAGWEDRFDYQFPEFGFPRGTRNYHMKQFIREEITAAEERGRGVKENISTLKIRAYELGFKDGQRDTLEKVKEMIGKMTSYQEKYPDGSIGPEYLERVGVLASLEEITKEI